jgi:Mg-dependent DNase
LDRMMLETDAPYCEIRNSHAGACYVKTKFASKPREKFQPGYLVRGRNEPCNIIQVAEVVSAVLNIDIKELTETAYRNTLKMFNLKDDHEISNEEKENATVEEGKAEPEQ